MLFGNRCPGLAAPSSHAVTVVLSMETLEKQPWEQKGLTCIWEYRLALDSRLAKAT